MHARHREASLHYIPPLHRDCLREWKDANTSYALLILLDERVTPATALTVLNREKHYFNLDHESQGANNQKTPCS